MPPPPRNMDLSLGLALLLAALLPSAPLAAWETGWPCRRPVLVDFAPDRLTGDDLAIVDLHTAGHHQPSGQNIRVTTDAGQIIPARLLMTGPGDRIRVAFALRPPNRRYYVYFGNPKAPPPRPAEQLTPRAGVLLETRQANQPRRGNIDRIDQTFDSSKTLLGRTILSRPYTGVNPFGEQTGIICRYTGVLRIPSDGSYTFAASATDRGALFLDGKQVLLVHGSPHDTRFNATIDLTRGPHEFAFYQESLSGLLRLSVVWKRPAADTFEIIPAEAFGLAATALPGPMEQKDKSLTADFRIEYLGECFLADHYTHRYRFTAQLPRVSGFANPRFEWDLGNGQTATGPVVEQVYLNDGIYPVKLTARSGVQSDTQTNRLAVSRQYEHLNNPPTDTLRQQATVLAASDVARLPSRDLPWATLLHARAKSAAIEPTAVRLAGATGPLDAALAMRALEEASDELLRQGKLQGALRIWESVPLESPIQPRAATAHAQTLLWHAADFSRAVRILSPLASRHPRDRDLQITCAQALLLDQRAPEARNILTSLPVEGAPGQQAAIAGALARTIEFYIAEKDSEAGRQAWDDWQRQYPADFLEGYSLTLRVRLIELDGSPAAAARVAEAFASAMPRSSYAPKLLDRASRLLEKIDPARSRSLRETLKSKYPEDPLSQ